MIRAGLLFWEGAHSERFGGGREREGRNRAAAAAGDNGFRSQSSGEVGTNEELHATSIPFNAYRRTANTARNWPPSWSVTIVLIIIFRLLVQHANCVMNFKSALVVGRTALSQREQWAATKAIRAAHRAC
jgi:hypothetical protein